MEIIGEYNLLFNAALLIEQDVGCALCFDNLVDIAAIRSLCFRPLEPALEARMVLVWRKGQILSKPARKFLDLLTERIGREMSV